MLEVGVTVEERKAIAAPAAKGEQRSEHDAAIAAFPDHAARRTGRTEVVAKLGELAMDAPYFGEPGLASPRRRPS